VEGGVWWCCHGLRFVGFQDVVLGFGVNVFGVVCFLGSFDML
jgi:hypothetical protein